MEVRRSEITSLRNVYTTNVGVVLNGNNNPPHATRFTHRRDLKKDLTLDTYVNSSLVSTTKPVPGAYASIPLEVAGGDWDVKLVVSFKQEGKTWLPIAGAQTTVTFINATQSLRIADMAAKVSGTGLDSLRGIQRSLSRETRHGFVTKGIHIFSPEGGGFLEERYVKGGSSLQVLYDIPFLNVAYPFTSFEKAALLSTPPITVELVVTIPENSTCPSGKTVEDMATSSKKNKNKKVKGPPSGIKMDACGGYYGEMALPLVSPLGSVSFRNLGFGQHYLRFRLLTPTGIPIFLSPLVTSSKSAESVGSLGFSFSNGTMRGSSTEVRVGRVSKDKPVVLCF